MADRRARILVCACEVFAEKGYSNSTVGEICENADANVASVSYYFGGKEGLYKEALHQAFQVADVRFPLDGGLPDDAPPEDRLRAFVSAKVGRVFCDDSGGHAQRMAAHEFSNPVSSVSNLFKEALAPQRDILGRIIRDMATTEVSEGMVRVCGFNIISLCDSRSFDKRARSRFLKKRVFSKEDIGKLAENITQFALGGIRSALEGGEW